MKKPLSMTLALLAGISSLAQAESQEMAPTGELTINHAMVRQGVSPALSWTIEHPAKITDLATLSNGTITPKAPLKVTAQVVGAAFDNGHSPLPVRGYIKAGNAGYQRIFNGTSVIVNPSSILFSKTLAKGESISFKANGAKNPLGTSWYSTRYGNSNEVKLLKDGDTAPGLSGLRDQTSLEGFLRPYTQDGKLLLGPMDLIYAAELYSTNPNSRAYDLQDIVVLLRFEAVEENEDSYMNYVTQTHVGTNLPALRLNDVDSTGNATAPEGVNGSSIFRLWSVHRTTGKEFLLDEKIVSSYHPEATIQITAPDSYNGVPRTRVDKPFTVRYKIKGLLKNNPNAPTAAKSVILQTALKNYRSAGDVSHVQGKIKKNGTTKKTRLTLINANELTVGGEEEFTVFANPDYGVTDSHMLASAKIQVWPIAEATLTGIKSDTPYSNLPNYTVDLKNLYPKSVTYVRVYAGAPTSNPTNATIVNGSHTNIDQAGLGNRKFTLNGKSLGVTTAGNYTVEILHNTIYGSEVICQTYPVQLKNSIKINGNLNTSE